VTRAGLVSVLICGERLRGDDGAAVFAAGLLTDDVEALASITEVGQLSVEALLATPPDAAVILVDSALGIAPGQVVELPLSALAGEAGNDATPASTHAMPAHQVLTLAAELRGAPLYGTFVGLGGVAFGFGEELSPAVAAGLPEFAAAIESEIRRLAAG
jgi:hydrogenase maturation protease